MGTPAYCFGHRPEPRKVSASPFKLFIVRCGKCQGERLRVVSDMDADTGEIAVFLVCPCGQREKLPVS